MGCGCEKDKAKKECNDFTKAVINIENPEVLTLFHKVVIPASMGDEEAVPPVVGKYHNTLLYYEASGNSYLYSSDGIPTKVTGPKGEQGPEGPAGRDGRDGQDGRDGAIQYTAGTGIDISESNVISATGSASVSWGDINGSISNQTDLSDALAAKQGTLTAGANIAIDADNVISATDTTYSNFTGTDGVSAGTAGLVPGPTTSDTDKYLKSDGTWATVSGGSGPTVVQTTGTSQTDVMSQNAVSSMVFADPGTDRKIQIGLGATVSEQYDNIAIGHSAIANGVSAVAIGSSASSRINGVALGNSAKAGNSSSQNSAVALGYNAQALGAGAIALGRDSSSTTKGEMNIGTSSTDYGYNSSNYRLLSGLYDPQSAHDAATKGYVDSTTPIITMQTTDPGEGSALAENHYIGVYGGDPIIMDYSLSEINTGATWITGDIIYKRTVSLGALPNATTATVAHNISNFNTLVKLEGVFTNGTNSGPIPYASPTATKSIQAYVDATNITIVTGEDRSGFTGYATIYYTKTTNPA